MRFPFLDYINKMPHFNIETSLKLCDVEDMASALQEINQALGETLGVPFEHN